MIHVLWRMGLEAACLLGWLAPVTGAAYHSNHVCRPTLLVAFLVTLHSLIVDPLLAEPLLFYLKSRKSRAPTTRLGAYPSLSTRAYPTNDIC